jgi:hypothetical protein
VSSRGNRGLSNEASGRVKSSNAGGASSSPNVGDGWIRIREAGVAGATPGSEVWAFIAGDGCTEFGLGGGPISERGPGEMESDSELSRLQRRSAPLDEGWIARSSSSRSVTSLGGISADTVALRRAGLTIGDCRTRAGATENREGALLLAALLSFRPWLDWLMAGSSSISISTSTGDAPVELPEVVP